MNIVYTVFSFRVGGIEKLLIDIVNNLSEQDNIYLYIINDEYDKNLISEINGNVKIIYANRKVGGSKLGYIFDFCKFVKENKIKVIHCQCINTVKFSFLAKVINPSIKLIHTVHDTKIYSRFNKFNILIDKICVNKIIAISKSVKDEIISKGIDEDKVKIIYNAIDLSKFKLCKNKVMIKDEIIIGNVARLVPEKKGQDILIKAMGILKDKYPNMKCLFAGDPPSKNKENIIKLKQLAVNEGVEKRVEFLGNVNDISCFLSKIDIFVLPSVYEGFGISLIEAMATGVPCIAANIDGPKEIIKDNEYGLLFESKNFKDLAMKIDNMIYSYSYNNQNRIKSYIEENYEIKSMIKKLYKVYCN